MVRRFRKLSVHNFFLTTFLLPLLASHLLALPVITQADELSFKGNTEAISRFDGDGRNRYELNLFGGKLKDANTDALQIQGGAGIGDYDDGSSLSYAGGVVRAPTWNDTTIIYNYSDDLRRDSDFQFKTRIIDQTYFGAGLNELRSSNKDSYFASLFQEFSLPSLIDENEKLLIRGGWISFEDRSSGEAAVQWSGTHGSLGANFNREEFRASAGFIQEKDASAEVTYVDGDQGRAGVRAVMVNAVLVKDHPFLSNAAREGRLLGRSGVSSANPILPGSNFFDPYTYNNFNRLQFVQDIGDGVVARYRHFEFPNANEQGFADLLVFPGYFAKTSQNDPFRKFYLGFAYDYTSTATSDNTDAFGLVAGFKGMQVSENLKAHVHFRGVGIFQSEERNIYDIIVYLTYSLT